VHRFRRWFQAFSLAGFLILLAMTVWPLGQVFLGAFLVADPLIAANSLLNGVAIGPLLALAVVMLGAPLVLGRAFCGYLCPTGALVEWLGPSAGPGRLSAAARNKVRIVPAFVLIGSAGLALFAGGAFLLLDPLSTLTRTATLLLFPLLDRLIRLLGDVLALPASTRVVADYLSNLVAGRLVFTRPLAYDLQLFALAFFSAMVGLSWVEPRMWCRHLCPLGALLGLTGRAQLRGRTVDAEKCIACGKCVKVCPLDAVSDDYLSTDASRCQLCLECGDACPTDAIATGARPARIAYLPSRRAVLGATGLSLAAGFFAYTGLGRAERNVRLIRPPGARPEFQLLALCSRCGQCMKVCPSNVIQPAVFVAGVDGFFTPRMDYQAGECEWSCNECGKVCPTGAIERLTLTAKRKRVIGRATIDKNRCYPWADGLTCLVCQELCPLPEKAIAIDTGVTVAGDGRRVRLGRPRVVPSRCIGCGVCEHVCPVPNESAIRVFAIDRERRGG
jgi:ferredoxin